MAWHDRGAVDAEFHTTHWSAVLAAREPGSSQAERALTELCQTYWYPLYAYIRRRGYSPTEAEDLTQGFFARLLDKHYIGDITPGMGRFRCFLLASLKHFLANEWDRVQTRKRGGGQTIFSLDAQQPEARYQFEPVDNATPELLFERRWAVILLEQVLSRLRAEFVGSEQAGLFDELKGFLCAGGETPGSYREIAERMGLKEGAVKVAVHRLRRRYGELLRAEIGKTLSDPREVEEEVRHLIGVLTG
jgi:RNA polymerase sigma-70 factor (ECF subfamily)